MLRPLKAAVVDLQRQLDEIFDELIYRPWAIAAPSPWRPAVDIHETADAYFVEVDLPGIPPEEVSIRVTERELTVSGERRSQPPEGALQSCCERPTGPFRRSLTFSRPLDPEKCQAECREGICRIRLPKAAQPTARPGEATVRVTVR